MSGSTCACAAPFRVRVSLERFYSDERARVALCVRGARRVRWLARRLRRTFALPPRLLLLSAGHLLPPDEPLHVLAPGDLVHVLPAPPHYDLDATDRDRDALQESKRRALLHLERLCGESVAVAPEYPAPEDIASEEPTPEDPVPSDPAPSEPAPSEPAPSEPPPRARRRRVRRRRAVPYPAAASPVLRNGSQERRAPRLVCALASP